MIYIFDEFLDEQTQEVSTGEETVYTFTGLSEYKRYFLTYTNESGHDETFVGQVTN